MSPRLPSRRRLERLRTSWVPGLLLLCVTLPHLGQGDWQRTDTGWYAAIAVQAWRTGELWTLHAQPEHLYFNKPPLVFWIHGLVLHAFGTGAWQARLPTVGAALACVLLTVSLARRFAGRRAAMASGIVLALSVEFFRRTREISLDLWQLAFMLAAVRLAGEGIRRVGLRWFAAAGVPLGLALLCKPLVALIVPVMVWVWMARRRPPPPPPAGEVAESARPEGAGGAPRVGSGAPPGPPPPSHASLVTPPPPGAGPGAVGAVLMVVVALAVAAPWHVSMALTHGDAFTAQYFGREIAQRAGGEGGFSGGSDKPAWFYAAQIARTYWPWMLALIPALVAAARGRLHADVRLTRWAILWTVGWLVLLTLFPDRRDRYAVVLYPSMAVLCGLWLTRRRYRVPRAACPPVPDEGEPHPATPDSGGVRTGGRAARGTARPRRLVRRHWPLAAAFAAVIFAATPVQVHRPINPQWPALFSWLREHGSPQVWEGSFSGAHGSRLYLEFGRWPIATKDRHGSVIATPPRGALVIYHEEDGPGPAAHETVIYPEGLPRQGEVFITRVN